MEIGANSTLFVAKVNKTDSGNYTCSIGEAQFYTVLVHVLNGKFTFLMFYKTISYYCMFVCLTNILPLNKLLNNKNIKDANCVLQMVLSW